MVPVPVGRPEALQIVDGTDEATLFAGFARGVGWLPSQRRFLVGPGGRHLAYDGLDGDLRVRDRFGNERRIADVNGQDVRFSPDGRYVAAVAGPNWRGTRVTLVDLETGALRTLGAPRGAAWMEWVAGGVVVLETADLRTLVYLPLDGEPRTIVRSPAMIVRFTASSRGTRVAWFARDAVDQGAGEALFTVDLADQTAPPRRIAGGRAAVVNAEMSPDGAHVAFVTSAGVFVDDEAHAVARERGVQSVWWDERGRLLWASNERATVLDGNARATFAGPVVAARFRKDGAGVVVSRPDGAWSWDPATGAATRLAAPASGTLAGADVFDGKAVLWTTGAVRYGHHDAAAELAALLGADP